MKLLKCKLCHGEMDIIGNERAIYKKVKCKQCGFSNESHSDPKMPEVIFIRKKRL